MNHRPEDLLFAASARCKCGSGFAYRPARTEEEWKTSPRQWECGAVLLGTADPSAEHSEALPFAFYEVKSEDQPSARGATTRPVGLSKRVPPPVPETKDEKHARELKALQAEVSRLRAALWMFDRHEERTPETTFCAGCDIGEWDEDRAPEDLHDEDCRAARAALSSGGTP